MTVIAAPVNQRPIYRVLEQLQRVRQLRDGHYMAICPHHDDHDPSLSIGEADDGTGTVLLHCFAGCTSTEIVKDIGLEMADLFTAWSDDALAWEGRARSRNGLPALHTPSGVQRYARDEASGQQPHRESEGRSTGFTLTRIGALLDEPDETVACLVPDLVPTGGLVFIAAKPKAGKSTLCRNLALAVAQGGDFLGRPCAQGTVIYLALEERRAEVRRHFASMGATDEDPIWVHVATAPTEALAELAKLIQEHKPVLVIIDPLLRFTRVKDEKAYAELSNALEGVMALARTTNCTIVATHHSPKAQSTETVDSLLGSTAISGAPDTIMVLRRRDQERTIESIQRYGTDMERTVLALDKSTGIVTVAGTAAEIQEVSVRTKILDLLRNEKGALTTMEICDALEMRRAAVLAAEKTLLESEEVVRVGEGKRGEPFLFSVPTSTLGTEKQSTETARKGLQDNAESCSQDRGVEVDASRDAGTESDEALM